MCRHFSGSYSARSPFKSHWDTSSHPPSIYQPSYKMFTWEYAEILSFMFLYYFWLRYRGFHKNVTSETILVSFLPYIHGSLFRDYWTDFSQLSSFNSWFLVHLSLHNNSINYKKAKTLLDILKLLYLTSFMLLFKAFVGNLEHDLRYQL